MEETLTNIISYGYRDNREHQVKVRLSVQLAEVSVEIEDGGQPFNPLEAAEPDVTKPWEERKMGGLGIHLVRKLRDRLGYKRQGERNLLTIKKKKTSLRT
jgi:anti-sigma regulatory factor (Ser/Thr protein kinase)